MRKLLSTTIAAGIFVSMGITPVFALSDTALPEFNSAGSSKVTVTDPYIGSDGKTTMDIKIDKGVYNVGTANWDSFNIGKDAKVNVLFSSHHQTSFNKVAATGGLSQIYGSFLSGDNCAAACGYYETGKVILLNPNGVLFGNGANINLNSFTVSNMDGTLTENAGGRDGYIKLNLSKYNGTLSDNHIDGIKIEDGAKIKTDTNFTVAANNIDIYSGSQISTNTIANNVTFVNNEATEAFGKAYLVTSDGVNFTFHKHGGVESMENTVAKSNNAMKLNINGDVTTGHLEAYNYSINKDSEISTNGALIKAVKATKGNDGTIKLVSDSRVVSTDSTIGAGGDLVITGPQKVNFNGNTVEVAGDVTLSANDGDGQSYTKKITKNGVETTENYTNDGNVLIESSKVTVGKKLALTSEKKIAGIQNSEVQADDIEITGKTFGQVTGKNTKVTSSKDIVIAADDIWFDKGSLKADGKIKATAANNIYAWDSTGNKETSFDAPTIELTATSGDVTSYYPGSTKTGTYNFNNNKVNIKAGNDINIKVKGVSNPNNGLVAEAENNVTIKTPENLSISKLIANNGDMTISANKMIAGKNYVPDSEKITGEGVTDPVTDNRSYIYVRNGKFNSNNNNTENDKFYVTASSDQDPTDSTKYYRHHIEYGNGDQKFVLINKRNYIDPKKDDTNNNSRPNNDSLANNVVGYPSVNDQQASMLEKIPRSPEAYNGNTQIADGRTTFVDVFAAASQIEIEDED